MQIRKSFLYRRLLLSVLMSFISLSALAQQNWPVKTIRLIVPFAPGGATDQVARLLGMSLSTQLGVAVVVENKPGANGTIGADMVAKAAPDAIPCCIVRLPLLLPKRLNFLSLMC